MAFVESNPSWRLFKIVKPENKISLPIKPQLLDTVCFDGWLGIANVFLSHTQQANSNSKRGKWMRMEHSSCPPCNTHRDWDGFAASWGLVLMTLLCPSVTRPSVVFKWSKHVEYGVNGDKRWNLAPHVKLKQRSHQCPKALVKSHPAEATGRYLSCDDSRPQTVCTHCWCCCFLWIHRHTVLQSVCNLRYFYWVSLDFYELWHLGISLVFLVFACCTIVVHRCPL